MGGLAIAQTVKKATMTGKRYAGVWGAIEGTAEEAQNMKLRSARSSVSRSDAERPHPIDLGHPIPDRLGPSHVLDWAVLKSARRKGFLASRGHSRRRSALTTLARLASPRVRVPASPRLSRAAPETRHAPAGSPSAAHSAARLHRRPQLGQRP